MVDVIDNNTVSDNVLWLKSPNQAPILMAVSMPVILWMIPALMFLQGLFGDFRSFSHEDRSRLKDTILFTFITLSQATLMWLYLAMTPYFLSAELQITMLIFLFTGPQIASVILFAPYRDCFEHVNDLLDVFGLTASNNRFLNCDMFGPILRLLKFIVNMLVVGVIVVCYGVLGILGAVLFGYYALSTLQCRLPFIIKGAPGKENAHHLLNAMIVHLLFLSLPEIVMVAWNIRLDHVKEVIVAGTLIGTRIHANQQYLWATIIFFILFVFESALAIRYGMKCFRMSHPSSNLGPAQVSSTTSRTIPMAQSAPVQDSALSITDVQPSKTHVKTLDDELNEPKWMNIVRYPANRTNTSPSLPTLQCPSLTSAANTQGADGSFSIECPICYTTGGKKKVLIPCGHMLCEECFVSVHTRTTSILCPFCHAKFTLTTDLYF